MGPWKGETAHEGEMKPGEKKKNSANKKRERARKKPSGDDRCCTKEKVSNLPFNLKFDDPI